MIATIIEGLDLAASQQLPTGARSGLAELRPVGGGTAPYTYSGDGNWTQIANDNAGTYSYWRLTSPVVEVDTDGPSCNDYFQATYQLRLVSMVERALCGNVIDAARSAASAIRGADGGVATALGLSIPRTNVSMVRVDTDSSKVYQNEFGQASDVPPDRALIAIDVTFVAIGSAACFAPCEVPGSLLCLSIEHATWAKIKACMSMVQIDAAEADLCTGGGPCDPLTVTLAGVEIVNEAEPCGAEIALECDDLVDAVVVEGAGTTEVEGTPVDGLYRPNNSVSNPYKLSGVWPEDGFLNRTDEDGYWLIIIAGDQVYRATLPGGAKPWDRVYEAHESGETPAPTVRQATIGDICAVPCDPHLFDIQVNVNGVPQTPVTNVDPSVNNTLNIIVS